MLYNVYYCFGENVREKCNVGELLFTNDRIYLSNKNKRIIDFQLINVELINHDGGYYIRLYSPVYILCFTVVKKSIFRIKYDYPSTQLLYNKIKDIYRIGVYRK